MKEIEKETTELTTPENTKIVIFLNHSLNGNTLDAWGKELIEYCNNNGILLVAPRCKIRQEASYANYEETMKPLTDKYSSVPCIMIAHSISCAYLMKYLARHHEEFNPQATIFVAPDSTKYAVLYDGKLFDENGQIKTRYVDVKKDAVVSDEELEILKQMGITKIIFISDEENKMTNFGLTAETIDAELKYIPGKGHFVGDFPELFEILNPLIAYLERMPNENGLYHQ